jgi:Mce-associated membrane protein
VNASWYDLLDVAPDASEAEIRAAWRARVADLDPTDRTFRVYNQAAEVLLDPQRRAAYDAEQRAAEEHAAQTHRAEGRAPATAASTVPRGATALPTGADAPGAGFTVPAWLLAGVAVLTAIAVGACVWVVTTRPSDAAVRESTRSAQSAAERAIGPILSYSYKTLDQDQKAAESYLTSDYRTKYAQLFAVIKENAPRTRTVVTTQVADSGVIRSGEDRVDVLLFVNRPTTNQQTRQPQVYKDQVTARMLKVGNDWLVDCLLTSSSNDCG